ALWFNGLTGVAGGFQLFKLGFDGSVTQWTAIPGVSLNPQDLTGFNGNEWFNGATATQGNQLYKLGFDGSVTKWTAINPGGAAYSSVNNQTLLLSIMHCGSMASRVQTLSYTSWDLTAA